MSLDERIKKDLEELYNYGEILGAHELSVRIFGTSNLFSSHGLPGHFTGNRDAETVMVMLNPGIDVAINDNPFTTHKALSKFGINTDSLREFVKGYITWRQKYGELDAGRYDHFDVKQAAFLFDCPFSYVDNNQKANWSDEDFCKEVKERVLMNKLQLELVPYASSQFNLNKNNIKCLLPYVETLLDEIFRVNPRKYVIFGGTDFDTLFELYNKENTKDTFMDLTEKQSIPLTNLKKKDGSNWTTPLNYKVIGINYHKNKQKALIAYTYPLQSLTNAFGIMRAYGQRCWKEYDKKHF